MRGPLAEWLEAEWLKWQAEAGRRRSQREFALWLGVPEGTLTHWISGSRRKLDEPNIQLLADKLGPEIYDVLGRPRPDDRLEKIISVWGRLPEAVRLELVERAEQGAETGNDNAASGEVPSGVAAPKRGGKK